MQSCERCNLLCCQQHIRFDTEKRQWLCARCKGADEAAAKTLADANRKRSPAVNKPKRLPIWEEALAA